MSNSTYRSKLVCAYCNKYSKSVKLYTGVDIHVVNSCKNVNYIK